MSNFLQKSFRSICFSAYWGVMSRVDNLSTRLKIGEPRADNLSARVKCSVFAFETGFISRIPGQRVGERAG